MTGDNVTSAASNYPAKTNLAGCPNCGAKIDVAEDGSMSCPYCDEVTKPLADLLAEALESCELRGHDMGSWQEVNTAGRTIYRAACKGCGKEVDVEVNPPANGIDIGGEAVALGCEKVCDIDGMILPCYYLGPDHDGKGKVWGPKGLVRSAYVCVEKDGVSGVYYAPGGYHTYLTDNAER
jgi:transcription elongation factor Elf1